MRASVQEENQSSPWDASQDPTVPPSESVRQSINLFGELREYLSYYLSAKSDAYKASFRKLGVLAAIGILALAVAVALVATATVLLCLGIAQALAAAMHDTMWAGNLIVGAGLLLIIFGAVILGSRMLANASRKRTMQKYELRQEQQRRDFGRTVAERAAAEGQVSE
jgi:cytochrome c biogenesis protein CcdA